jgi:hypothetical protein
MATTVQDLVQSSLRLLRATTHGRTPSSPVLTDALAALNQLVDQWGTERLTFYTTSRTVFNVVAGQQVYTIGPSGADWTAPRPPSIDEAGLLLSGTTATEIPLTILRTQADWAAIRVKGVASSIPSKLYYQDDYPSGQIALWPSPSASSQVALYTPVAISQFTSLAQTISLPPGYEKALRYALAIELAPEFVEGALNPLLLEQADDAKRALHRANLTVNRVRVEAALTSLGGRRGRFDVLIGESR